MKDSAMHCVGCRDDISKISCIRRSLCSDSVGDPRATKADFTVATWPFNRRLGEARTPTGW